MTKRKKTVAILSVAISVLTIGASVMVSNGFVSEQDPVSGELLEVTGVSGIKFASTTTTNNEDGSITQTIQYVIEPASAYLNDFIVDFGWAETEEEGKDWESDDWAKDKTFDDYLVYEIDQPNCELSITCYQPFGTTAVLTMSDETYDVSATMNIDYRRKIKTYSTASISSQTFTNGKAIKVTASAEEYSIGSVGDRARESITPTLSMSYSGGSSTYSTFDSLFADPTTTGLKSIKYKYKNADYTDASSLKSAIISNTKAYLESIPTTDGTKTFSTSEFKECLVYSGHIRNNGTTEVYSSLTNISTKFIERYNAAYEAGGGYTLTAGLGYSDKADPTYRLALGDLENETTEIRFPDGDIEF